jgi:O-succinylhomoserine sulfhydrylase
MRYGMQLVLLFASGMAAVYSTLAALLNSEITSSSSVFGATHCCLLIIFKMEHTNSYFDINQPETIEGLITPDTKFMLLILIGIVWILPKKAHLILIIDNCFATLFAATNQWGHI